MSNVAIPQKVALSIPDILRRILKNHLFRSIIQALFTIWLVLTTTFILVRALPSRPDDVIVNDLIEKQGYTYEAARARASAIIGTDLNAPLPQQYMIYLGGVLRGDLGLSITSRTPVGQIVAQYLPWTLFSVGLALLLSFVVGVLLGMLMAYWRNSVQDVILTTVASFLNSVPNYLIAILIFVYLGLKLQLFSISGARGGFTPGIEPGFNLPFILDILGKAALPILTYFITTFGTWALIMKNSTVGVLGEEYVNAARARGLSQGRIMLAYVGRNATLPLFTQLALSIGFIVGGSILIELYFTYPGIGLKLYTAYHERDYTLMQGIFLVITITVILSNFLADLLYGQLDPRIRTAQGSA